jgi:hypothetical protein
MSLAFRSWTVRLCGVFAVGSSSFALPLSGQTTVIPASVSTRVNLSARAMHTPVPATIETAEAEGAAWPRPSQPSTQPEYTATHDFGVDVPRKCNESVGADRQIHSGEFLIGGEVGSGANWFPAPGREAKIWWAPRHPAEGDTLVVRARLIDGAPADTSRFVSANWVVNSAWFYASGYMLPSHGRWLLVATSGPDWGCFVLFVD